MKTCKKGLHQYPDHKRQCPGCMSIHDKKRRSADREKLKELRQSASTLKPEVRGSEEERAAVAMKGFENWADLRRRV